MAPGRKLNLHANPGKKAPEPKNPKKPNPFSAGKILVANAALTVVVAGVIALGGGCPQNSVRPGKTAKKTDSALGPTAPSSNSFEVNKEDKLSVTNSLQALPTVRGHSISVVLEAGRKALEANKPQAMPRGYEAIIDHYIDAYDEAGAEMVDAVLLQLEKTPYSEKDAFLNKSQLSIISLLLRPYAAWEGPEVLKEYDKLLASQEFSQDSLDRFAWDHDLMREYFELTMNVGNRFFF